MNNKTDSKNYTIDGPAPVSYHMGNGVLGSYDNRRLQNPGCGWRKPPCNVPLLKQPIIYQGTPLPLKNEVVTMPLPKESMFVFQKNQARPECCPSTFSTSTGCVCTTPQQRKYIGAYDGNNKCWPTNPSGL